MYVYRSKYGNTIFTPTIPDIEQYWEVDEFPPGKGAIQITEDGELYRLGASTPTAPKKIESQSDTANLFVDSLLN